mmetsp:Transcript_66479/g.147235  ORF Transcript_66479/g.147235 Transcript_66479/m.147235 type:complete len:255 (+) Transcript_66479:64-828(+)
MSTHFTSNFAGSVANSLKPISPLWSMSNIPHSLVTSPENPAALQPFPKTVKLMTPVRSPSKALRQASMRQPYCEMRAFWKSPTAMTARFAVQSGAPKESRTASGVASKRSPDRLTESGPCHLLSAQQISPPAPGVGRMSTRWNLPGLEPTVTKGNVPPGGRQVAGKGARWEAAPPPAAEPAGGGGTRAAIEPCKATNRRPPEMSQACKRTSSTSERPRSKQKRTAPRSRARPASKGPSTARMRPSGVTSNDTRR